MQYTCTFTLIITRNKFNTKTKIISEDMSIQWEYNRKFWMPLWLVVRNIMYFVVVKTHAL